jgi:hypothetical protein
MRLEELGQLKNPVTSSGNEYDLPACSIVPQATTSPRSPITSYSQPIKKLVVS